MSRDRRCQTGGSYRSLGQGRVIGAVCDENIARNHRKLHVLSGNKSSPGGFPMRLAAIFGLAVVLALTVTASGQEVFSLSNTVKIGVLTDMSSLYSDIGGPGS